MAKGRGDRAVEPVFLADGDITHPFRLVASSAITDIGFHVMGETPDGPVGVLYVTLLVDGRTRAYGNVPLAVYEEMMVSPSKGKFYNANIRVNPDYQFLTWA